jgi:hypothetical protein
MRGAAVVVLVWVMGGCTGSPDAATDAQAVTTEDASAAVELVPREHDAPKPRCSSNEHITNVPIQQAQPKHQGATAADEWISEHAGVMGWKALMTHAVIELGFQLPAGATLERIDVLHLQSDIQQDAVRMVSWKPFDWSDPELGFDVTDVAGETASPGGGVHVTPIVVHQVIDPARSYYVEFTAGLANARFVGMRLVWDPCPRAN